MKGIFITLAAVVAVVAAQPSLAQGPDAPEFLSPGEPAPTAPPGGSTPPSNPPPGNPPPGDSGGTPVDGSWPDMNTVGIKHPDCPSSLSSYSGPNPITANGAVVQNVTTNSALKIQGDNVVLRCVRVSSPGGSYGILIDGATNVLIEKVTVTNVGQTNSTGQAKGIKVLGNGLTVRYSDISGAEDGIHTGRSNVTIENNWIHDNYYRSGLHSDGITVSSGSNVTIRHNRFGPFPNSLSASIMVQPAAGVHNMSDIDIIENYIDSDGLGHTLLNDHTPTGAGSTCPTDMDILDNQFGPDSDWHITYGSGSKACPKVGSRGGSCSGNVDAAGNPIGC